MRRIHRGLKISASLPDLERDVDFEFDSGLKLGPRSPAAEDWSPGTWNLETQHSAAPPQARLRPRFPARRLSRSRASRPPGLVRVFLLFAERRLSHWRPPLRCLRRRRKFAKLVVLVDNGWYQLHRLTVGSAGYVGEEAGSNDRDRRGKVCQGPS